MFEISKDQVTKSAAISGATLAIVEVPAFAAGNLTADQAVTQIDGISTGIAGIVGGAFAVALVTYGIHFTFHHVKKVIASGG